MFASRITRDVDVQDGESVVVVTVQKLSGNALQDAREARGAAQLASLRGASKELLQVFRSSDLDAAAEKLAAQRRAEAADIVVRARARYAEYDRGTVLKAGIVRWSVGEVTHERVADLDEEASQKLHEAILDLSLPSLDPAVGEAESGKG